MASHTSIHQHPQQNSSSAIDCPGPKQTTIDLVGGILCKICRLTFATKQSYDSHYRGHAGAADVVYACNICYKEFVGYPSFRGHCYTSHVIKERFQCEHCLKQFSKISNLKDHVNRIHKFKCPTCRKEFPSKKEMLLHRIIHNSLDHPPYNCNTCKIEIDTADDCKRHVEKHLKYLYSCPICNDHIADKENANDHMRKHFGDALEEDPTDHAPREDAPDEFGGIMCQICSLVLGDRVKFDAHFSCEHGDEDIVYMCVECGKSFEKYSVFKNHCNDHMLRNRHRCEICKKSFPRLSMLAAHTAACQAAGAARGHKVFACPQCSRRFASMWRWREHLRTAHGVHRHLPCPHDRCHRTFDTPKQLIVHQQSHEIKNQNFCSQCRLVFSNLASCERHIDMHKKKVFFCPVCKRNAKDKNVIMNHIAKHFDVVSHLCRICGKIYHSKRSLIEHLKTHKKVKSYSCSHCNKSFLKPSQLEQHVNTHTGVKPYKCPVCVKSFSNYPNWLKHVRRMHHEESIYMKNPIIDHADTDDVDKEHSNVEAAVNGKDFIASNNIFNNETYADNKVNNNYQLSNTNEQVSNSKIERNVTDIQQVNGIDIPNLIHVEAVAINNGSAMEITVDEKYEISNDSVKNSHENFFNIIEVNPIKSSDIIQQAFEQSIGIGNDASQIGITDIEIGTVKDIQKDDVEPNSIADEQNSNSHICDKPHKCPICEKTFAKYSYMSKHVGRVHHIRSIDIKNLIIDHKDDGEDENYVMETSIADENETFAEKPKADSDEHSTNSDKIKIQINSSGEYRLEDAKPYKCTVCDKTFAKYPYMTKHVRKVHNKKRIDVKNPINDKVFPGDEVSAMETGGDDESETSADIAKDNNNDQLPISDNQNVDKPHRCPICDKAFAKYPYMTKHVRKVHNKRIIDIKNAVNDHKDGVDDDLSTIETSIDGEFDISIEMIKDDNGFLNADNFSNIEHLTNIGSKPHKCPTCDKTFAKHSYVSKHVRTVHNKKGIDIKHPSSEDGSPMDTVIDEENDTFTDHSKDDNDDQISNTDNPMDTGFKPYKCPMCEKSFAKDRYCRKHVRRVHYKKGADANSPIFDPPTNSVGGTSIEEENHTVESQNYLKADLTNLSSIVNIVNDSEAADCLNDIDDANASIDFANVRLENYIFGVQRDSPMDMVPSMPEGKYLLNDNSDSNAAINKDLFKTTSDVTASIRKDIIYENKNATIGTELVNANGEAITLVEKDLFNASGKEGAAVDKDLFSGREQHDNPIDILEYIAEMPENNSLFVPVISQEALTCSAPAAEAVSYPCEYGPEFSGGFDAASAAGFIDLDDHMLPHIDPLLTITPAHTQPGPPAHGYDVIDADLLALGGQPYGAYGADYAPGWHPPVITKLCDQYAYGYGEMPEASRVPIMNTDIF